MNYLKLIVPIAVLSTLNFSCEKEEPETSPSNVNETVLTRSAEELSYTFNFDDEEVLVLSELEILLEVTNPEETYLDFEFESETESITHTVRHFSEENPQPDPGETERLLFSGLLSGYYHWLSDFIIDPSNFDGDPPCENRVEVFMTSNHVIVYDRCPNAK